MGTGGATTRSHTGTCSSSAASARGAAAAKPEAYHASARRTGPLLVAAALHADNAPMIVALLHRLRKRLQKLLR